MLCKSECKSNGVVCVVAMITFFSFWKTLEIYTTLSHQNEAPIYTPCRCCFLTKPRLSYTPAMVLVFSYGSNSTAQLKSRVENPALVSKGAYVDGYTRIFCLATVGGWRVSVSDNSVAPFLHRRH